MFWLLIWVIPLAITCSIWAKDIARLKGHDRTPWMVAGVFFGPSALLALAAYPDLEDRKHQRNTAAELSLIKDDIYAIRRSKD